MWLSKLKNKRISVELTFFISIAFSFLFESVFAKFQFQRFFNLIENILFAFILIIPLYFIGNKKLRNVYFIISFFLFNAILIIETSYYFIFNVNISPSSIYILFETNNIEALDFLSFYIDSYLIFYAVLIILIFVTSILIKNKHLNSAFLSKTKLIIVFISILVVLRVNSLRHQNLPYLVIKSFYIVYFESGILNGTSYQSEKGVFKETNIVNKKNNKLYVIIIGESTTSNNMSLYGYSRNTNPLLSKQDNLSVFKNVISPHAGTTASITKALSLENYEKSNKEKGSIVQLLNAANFETYWISNQQPVGFAETDITKLVSSCKHKFYLNTENTEELNLYDDVIFNKLDDVINYDLDKNKVLFIHLKGTHFYYENKYPNSFNIFKDKPKSQITTQENEYKFINEYDNAIAYNDFIINTIINKIKKKHSESFLLYFSDHGEEVYHTIKFAGHNDDVGTLPMFQIPFILWESEDYKLNNDIEIQLDRPYMIDDLFHSIANLCGVSNKHVDLERSVFSERFKNRKRVILNNKDYDSLLKINNSKH